jgi:zinc transport system substrate-binding protein
MLKSILLGSCLGLAATSAVGALEVVASVKPVHSLVAGVMAGTPNNPSLLVEGASSPHGFSMRPSDADAVSRADIVFWVGESYEVFLEGLLPTLAPEAISVPLIETPGVETLPFREGGLFEAHEDEAEEGGDGHDDHAEEGGADPHIWLDPQIARLLVARIAEELSAIDPGNAPIYSSNAERMEADLEALEVEITDRLQRVDGSFFVFHDAYHYYERGFGLEATGTFTVNPTIAPGVQRVDEIKRTIEASDATCIFTEPQFSPALIETLAKDTGAKVGILDPLGADIADGPELYFELMRQLTTSFEKCLG